MRKLLVLASRALKSIDWELKMRKRRLTHIARSLQAGQDQYCAPTKVQLHHTTIDIFKKGDGDRYQIRYSRQDKYYVVDLVYGMTVCIGPTGSDCVQFIASSVSREGDKLKGGYTIAQ